MQKRSQKPPNSFLVTGGTGSFGQAFVAEVARRFPKIKRLVVFSRDELKQFEMAKKYPESKFDFIWFFIGDVRNGSSPTPQVRIVCHPIMGKMPCSYY